jgi:hypothetical protein
VNDWNNFLRNSSNGTFQGSKVATYRDTGSPFLSTVAGVWERPDQFTAGEMRFAIIGNATYSTTGIPTTSIPTTGMVPTTGNAGCGVVGCMCT